MGLDPGLGVEGREGREVCGVATTMLGRHWNSRHPSPPNSRHGLLALRNRVAWRYFGHRGGATPPPAEFGGGEAPAIHGYAVEGWLLRKCPIDVRPLNGLQCPYRQYPNAFSSPFARRTESVVNEFRARVRVQPTIGLRLAL